MRNTLLLGLKVREGRTDAHLKHAILEKSGKKDGKIPPQTTIVEVVEDAISPGAVIGLFDIKEDRHQVLTPDERLCDGCLKAKKMIKTRTMTTKTGLMR